MVKKRKTAKRTAQKIGNPPKHPQFGKGTAGNPKAGQGAPKTSAYSRAAFTRSRREDLVGGRSRTISELEATTMSSLWL